MKQHDLLKGGSAISGAFFIAGTSIGAGMLALPFKTGLSGFGPAVAVNLICWLFMLCTGLLFLEATLWMPEGTNLLSIARRFLGKGGQVLGGVAFLFLYYCLLVAYFSGATPIFRGVFRGALPDEWIGILFPLLIGIVLWIGTRVTDRINFLLVVGLIASYLGLIGLGSSAVEGVRLQRTDWGAGWAAIPILFSAYGYHNIIPSMALYLNRDGRRLRWAIVVGTLIPLVVYLLWQWIVIGTLPQDLIAVAASEGEITRPWAQIAQSPYLIGLVEAFSLFAITTSVVGVGLSMIDFFADGTKIPREGWGRATLCLCALGPPAALAIVRPGMFVSALEYAGGFGEATLNGLLPVLMVWVGRYRFGLKSDYMLPGGRFSLSILLAGAIAIIVYQVVQALS
ncbi:MAG: amino acid permease [Parachlamydiales bacterium]